jgi:hypothetical protein
MSTEDGDGPAVSIFGRRVPAKALKPRIVLGLLLAGSFVGVWVTHLGDSVVVRAVTWLTTLTMGALAGGLYWRLVLFDGEGFDTDEDADVVRRRWRRLEAVGVVGLTVAGAGYFALAADGAPLTTAADPPGNVAFVAGVVTVPLLWVGTRFTDEATSGRGTALRAGLFVAALVALAGFARLETGTTLLDWGVRVGHLGAFSLWVGGAFWHNGVLLSTMRSSPGTGRVVKTQALRFRHHLPVVIAVVFATGLYQTARLVGLAPSALLGSRIGHLVGTKLLVLAVLSALVVASVRRE